MRRNQIILLLVGGVALWLGIAKLREQRSEMARLQSEVARLREEEREVQVLREENRRLQASRSEKQDSEALMEKELLRLRNESSQLRGQKQEFERASAVNRQLEAQNAELRAERDTLREGLATRSNSGRALPPPQRTGPWLGLNIRSVGEMKDEPLPPGVDRGVYVFATHPGGPAEQYGIRPGDVIVAVNDAAVATMGEFLVQLKGKPVGESVLLDLIRKGRSQRVAVVTAAWP